MAARLDRLTGRPLPTGRCRHCSRYVYNGGTACRARQCPGYAPLWAGDQRRKLFDNLMCFAEMHGGDGAVALVSVTGPGRDTLPWDRRLCRKAGPHECSGTLGCKADAAAAGEWNRTAPARWRRLHRRATKEPKARHPLGLWMLARVWEMQHRGVLHAHPVLAYGTTQQRVAARAYIDALARLAPHYQFGYVDRKIGRRSAKAAGGLSVVLLRDGQAGQGDSAGVGPCPQDAEVDRLRLDRPAHAALGSDDARAAVSPVRMGSMGRVHQERVRAACPPARGEATRARARA